MYDIFFTCKQSWPFTALQGGNEICIGTATLLPSRNLRTHCSEFYHFLITLPECSWRIIRNSRCKASLQSNVCSDPLKDSMDSSEQIESTTASSEVITVPIYSRSVWVGSCTAVAKVGIISREAQWIAGIEGRIGFCWSDLGKAKYWVSSTWEEVVCWENLGRHTEMGFGLRVGYI